MIFRLALKKAGLNYPLVVVRDGQQALDYLKSVLPGAPVPGPVPGLIILDLKMPRLDGFDVLSWLAEQPSLRNIPAVILSSSSYDQDVRRALRLGAREVHTKPSSCTDLSQTLRSISQRWLAEPPGSGVNTPLGNWRAEASRQAEI